MTSRHATPAPATREAEHLSELSPDQWKAGIAAWLGWLFDGLDMHLYTLVAAPFVMQLCAATSPADPVVKARSSWIQAAFLIGWALGGGFFGRVGDLLGRSRALGLTILTYAAFTGLSCVAHTWWHLMLFRFLSALGIGGEWAVGSSLLAETWPTRWRPWIAAVLQTGVNIGVLGACVTVYAFAGATAWLGVGYQPRWVFLAGVLPALLVFWIRRHVPEPAEWRQARLAAGVNRPAVTDLFRGPVRALTVKTILVCSLSLSAWWGFMFWHAQHLRNLPELASWSVAQREQLVSKAFFLVMAVSVAGNFFGAVLARWCGYRRAVALMLLGFFLAMAGAFVHPRTYQALVGLWFPAIGFFSGVFALFTMYLPPLFPVLLRTTGAGFSYNIGRIGAAVGTVVFGLFSQVGDFRRALLLASALFPAAALIALRLPEPDPARTEPRPPEP